MRERGLEPPHLAALAPQTSVSTIPPLALVNAIKSYFISVRNTNLATWKIAVLMIEFVAISYD